MELRSPRRKNEYKELKSTLNNMGYYEEGMELQEMRQVLEALQISANESETNFSDSDMQQALRESELDFMPLQDGTILSSTMISINVQTPPSSPTNTQPERIIVQAEVHHAMDWSPPTECLSRKRSASTSIQTDFPSISFDVETCSEQLEANSRNSFDLCVPYKKLKEKESHSSLQDIDSMENSVENSTEISISNSHEIHGPVSERRIRDSGLIESYETPNSTSFARSTSVSPSTADLSTHETSVSWHEIHGPVTVRIIHDSGLNLSTETQNASSAYSGIEQSVSSLENSEHQNL